MCFIHIKRKDVETSLEERQGEVLEGALALTREQIEITCEKGKELGCRWD